MLYVENKIHIINIIIEKHNTSSLNIHSETRVKWIILELDNINLLPLFFLVD